MSISATVSNENVSVTSESDEVCELNGMTEGEDTVMNAKPEGYEGERKVRLGPRIKSTQKERRTQSDSHAIQRLLHPLHDGQRTNSSPEGHSRRPAISMKSLGQSKDS